MTSVVFVLMLIALYFLPTILAIARSNRRIAQLVVVNALLGWTMIAWVLTLAWALEPQKEAA